MSEAKVRFKEVIEDEARTLCKMAEEVDYNVMSQIAEILASVKKKGKKVIVAGCGTAGMAGKRISHTLSVCEIPSFFLSPADSIHGGMGAMQKGDVLILLSKSGNTREILNFLPVAKAKELIVIGVTQNADSKLGQSADVILRIYTEKEPDKWGIISSASTLAFISAFDAIAFWIMEQTGYTKEEFYLIHTGGGVGDILRGQGMK